MSIWNMLGFSPVNFMKFLTVVLLQDNSEQLILHQKSKAVARRCSVKKVLSKNSLKFPGKVIKVADQGLQFC